jgi:hypothetical protein
MKFFSIFKKNLNLLINAKFSSFIFIFGPLILILLVGGALQDTSLKNINSGVYFAPGSESFIPTFMNSLEANSFNAIQFMDLEFCKQQVIEGEIHVCIEVNPSTFESFGGDYTSGGYDLNLYVDFSQQRIVWNVIGTIQRIAGLESENIRSQRVSYLQEDISKITTQIYAQKTNIDLIINQLDTLENSLRTLEADQNNFQDSLNNINNQLLVVLNNLETIQNSGELSSGYASSLSYSIDFITGVRSDVSDLYTSSFVNTDFESLADSVSYHKSLLQEASSSLESIQFNFQEFSDSDLERISNPISVSYSSVLDSQKGSFEGDLELLDYIFPSFLMFFILFSSLIYGSINIIRERKSSSYLRNVSSKLSGFSFIFSNFFMSLFVVFIQIFAIIILASFFVNLSVFSNPLSLILFLTLTISIFCLFGLLLGIAFNSQESTIVGAITFSLLFFMFSSIIAPLETLPRWLSKFISFTPFSMLETKARFILIFGSNLTFSFFQGIVLGS